MKATISRRTRFLLTCLLALAIAGGPLLGGCAGGDSGTGSATGTIGSSSPASSSSGETTGAASAGTSESSKAGTSASAITPAAGSANRIPPGTPSGPLRLACTPRTTLNPLLDTTDINRSISQLVYDGLYAIDAAGLPVTVLAEPGSGTTAPDGLSLMLRVAEGKKFHNGAAVSATDVAASFDALRAAGPATAHAGRQPDVTGIVASDARTLTITLARPQPDIAWQLTFPVLPAASLTASSANPLAIIPGTGPYRIASYTAGKGMILQAADNSDASRKALVRTIQAIELPGQYEALRAFERDGIDLTGLPASVYPSYALRNGLKLERYATQQYVFFSFRAAEGGLLANAARLAFVQAASRAPSVLADLESQGVERAVVPIQPDSPVWRMITPGAPGYMALYQASQAGPTVQAGQAGQAGAQPAQPGQSGQTSGSGVSSLKYPATRQLLVILAPAGDPLRLTLANRLQAVLTERGAAAETRVLPTDAYQAARTAGQYDILVAQAVVPDAADPRWLLGQAADPAVTGSELLPRTGMAGYQTASAAVDRLFSEGIRAAAERPDLLATLGEASRLGPFTGIGFRYAALASGSRVLGQPRPQAHSLYEGIEDLWLWST